MGVLKSERTDAFIRKKKRVLIWKFPQSRKGKERKKRIIFRVLKPKKEGVWAFPRES